VDAGHACPVQGEPSNLACARLSQRDPDALNILDGAAGDADCGVARDPNRWADAIVQPASGDLSNAPAGDGEAAG
jgi:hypothetical protein